jgi:hypothetical protein
MMAPAYPKYTRRESRRSEWEWRLRDKPNEVTNPLGIKDTEAFWRERNRREA